ncbi:hypothetical protein GCM10010102_36990 [Promicromonospora citrea]|uniref:CsbD-like domain-containing protein n=2 Tax=Promicromonospora citrea TaxID=43677 RepID=A0A8H9GQK2_9MICO|nr:hypothetical protein GCM10010102_36990 [Promicromonospora citrea]
MPVASAARAGDGGLVPPHRAPEDTMGMDDKIKHAAEDAGGKLKETTGRATDDEELQAEGEADQTKAKLKKAGDDVKDAFTD